MSSSDMAHEIVELPIEEIFSNYLPPVLQADIDKCHSHLQQNSVITNDRWSCFQEDPMYREDSEEDDIIFKDLETLFQAIVEAKKSLCRSSNHSCNNTVRLVQVPSKTTISEIYGGAFEIDFALEIIKSSVPEAIKDKSEFVEKIFSADVAGNVAVQKDDNPDTRYEDAKKAVCGAVHYMNNDPCRRFTFSTQVTIENTQMRLWYYSRSHSVVSTPFNFVEDTKSFIHFVLAFAFASPAALGYDPTVRRYYCDESRKFFYVFEIVQDEIKHYFRTIDILSEYRAARVSGRGTRVFLVQRCSGFNGTEPFGDKAVLKDFWLDERALPEWTIQADIFHRLEELNKLTPHPEWLTSITNHEELLSLVSTGGYKKYFMTILEHSQVQLGDACDHARGLSQKVTLTTLLRKPSTVSRHPTFPPLFEIRSPVLPNVTNEPVSSSREQTPREMTFSGRKHFRLVFKEVCQTFAQISQLNVAVSMLLHGLTALQLLYLARYVHRDISVGNILCYNQEQGKISDLEYAKPFHSMDELRKDAKTGTPEFMSTEVQAWGYMFRPPQSVRDLPKPPPFFHNFQHDVESLLWLFAWLVSHRILETVPLLPTQQDSIRLSKLVDQCFLGSDRNTFILRADPPLIDALLSIAWNHPLMSFIVNQLYPAKHQVHSIYSQLEKGDLTSLEHAESFSTIYNGMRDTFCALKEHIDAQSQSSQKLVSLTAYLSKHAPATPSSS